MDWRECIQQRIVKDVKKDSNLISSMREIAALKIRSADALPKELFIGKISLLYDALRELLESTALEHCFKIYNHECYSAFLKEILGLSNEANMFDTLRKIRNGINYYGRMVGEEEAIQILKDLKLLIAKFR